MNDEAAGAAPPPQLCAAETCSGAEYLITFQVNVVDARFAGFNTIHYLL